jgi:chemotaxis protein MotB
MMKQVPEQQEFKFTRTAPRWVVTFADLMTLLLCFFVLLFSFSETDRKKYKQVSGSLQSAFGSPQHNFPVMQLPKSLEILARDFDREMLQSRAASAVGTEIEAILSTQLETIRDQVHIAAGETGITIRLMGESTFHSGKDEIREQLIPLLRNVAGVLKRYEGDIIIAGHTDDVPVRSGPFQTNLRLSIARAAAVADFLLANSAIDPQRISTMGFGEFRPIESNLTEAGRKKNRRVEIILTNTY